MSTQKHTVQKEVLPNGITLLTIPMASTGAVTAMVFFGVGSRHESDAQQGLAHFTEHMVFKGGNEFTTAQAIAQAIDGVGGAFNAFTGEEFTGFYTKTAPEELGLGVRVLSDMLLHAKFPEEELKKEKGVIVEEINMYEDMPMRKIGHILQELLFGDTPLGRPVLGTKKSVKAFTSEDFLNYRKQFYKGSSCTIVIAGATDAATARSFVEPAFAELPNGDVYRPKPAVLVRDRQIAYEAKESEQTHFQLAIEAFSMSDPRRHALRLLSNIFGGTMSSRLFVRVREEQGLCYYVHSSTDTYTDCGFLLAASGVDNTRLDKALEAIIKELVDLRDNGVTAEELDRAKKNLQGRTLLNMEDSESVAEYFGLQHLLENSLETPAEALEEIMKVTLEEVNSLAKELIRSDKTRLAVIGPKHDVATLEAMLQF